MSSMSNTKFDVITVTINPAIDKTITISQFTPAMVNRVDREQSTPGGKGVNVASALADYGFKVAVTGFLGNENTEMFEYLFEDKNISDYFVRISGQTRVGIKISDSARGETTDINFPGIAPRSTELADFYQQLDQLDTNAASLIVLAGSVPPGIDPAIYRELIERFHARGQKVVLDSSGEPLRLALEAIPDIVKPNIHELEELLGQQLTTRESTIKAARYYTSKGVSLVVVSMGEEGALFVTADKVVTVRPPKIAVRSTVGAGDAMVAGIIAGHLRGLPLVDCARLATAFSLDFLTGGNGSMRSFSEIETSMQGIPAEVG